MYEVQADYEPDAIRKALPLEWAVGELFGLWGAGPAMAPCPLPGHEDSTPSFNLWAEDAEGFPQRYGCFGCGGGGDVVDLIRVHRDVGFLEACRIAVEELIPELHGSSWVPVERDETQRRTVSPEVLQLAWRNLQAGSSGTHLKMFMERKGLGGLQQYATTEWHWGDFTTPAPNAYFPHWDWEGTITGIRYRSIRRDAARWSEQGSRFPALYGAWRDRRYEDVLVCEGETDTVYAAAQLRGEPIDVLGLASGAAQRPSQLALENLAGRRVVLAFDADTAGRIATNRWVDALQDRPSTIVLPEGEDILSCGIPVARLLEGVAA